MAGNGKIAMNEQFEHWWNTEATFSVDSLKELCRVAWSNGRYKAIEECIKKLKDMDE